MNLRDYSLIYMNGRDESMRLIKRLKSFKTCMFWPVALVPMQIPFIQYKGADVLKDFKSFQFVAFSHKYIHMQYIYTVERYVAISY